MTGRTPYRVGVHNWIPLLSPMHVRKREITVATLLRQAGYATCHAGKWHLNGRFNLPGQPQPSDHGFDHWFSTQNNALPTHHNPENFVRNGKPVGKLMGYSSHLVVDEAVDWLSSGRDRQKPFFLFVCFHEPHEPIASAKRFRDLYSDEGPRSPYDPNSSSLAAHHGNITQMDAAFGRLMKHLDESGLRDETFVLFTSDNGPAITRGHPHGSAGPLRDKKGAVYEGGIRVPGIIRWPGRTKPGQVSREPVCGVDLLPTLCDIAGVPVPDDRAVDGTSILPIFSDKPIERATPLYWQLNVAHGDPKVALRDGDHKILATLTGPKTKPYGDIRAQDQQAVKTAELDRFELFNLQSDLGESTDLSTSESDVLGPIAAQLRQMFRNVQQESPTWPAWTWPRLEGKRIRAFRESLKKPAE
jgi:arylsulfatase A